MTAEGLALAFTIVCSIAGGIWQASRFASRLEAVGKRGHDNANDLEKLTARVGDLHDLQIRNDERINGHDGDYARLERKIDIVDGKLDRLLTRTPLPR